MEIARNPVDLEPSFHPAALQCTEIRIYSFFLLIAISNLHKGVVIGQIKFRYISSNIDFMHF